MGRTRVAAPALRLITTFAILQGSLAAAAIEERHTRPKA